jgi:hypothetical protein
VNFQIVNKTSGLVLSAKNVTVNYGTSFDVTKAKATLKQGSKKVNGTITWNLTEDTKNLDAGVYTVTVSATYGDETVTADILVTVKPAKLTLKVTKNLGTMSVADIQALTDEEIIEKAVKNITVTGNLDINDIAEVTISKKPTVKKGTNTWKLLVTLTDGNYAFGTKTTKTISVSIKGTN